MTNISCSGTGLSYTVGVAVDDATFNNGTLVSDLDHTLASTNLQLTKLGQRPDSTDFFVRVRGWLQLTGAARKDFIDNISDHCSIFVEATA